MLYQKESKKGFLRTIKNSRIGRTITEGMLMTINVAVHNCKPLKSGDSKKPIQTADYDRRNPVISKHHDRQQTAQTSRPYEVEKPQHEFIHWGMPYTPELRKGVVEGYASQHVPELGELREGCFHRPFPTKVRKRSKHVLEGRNMVQFSAVPCNKPCNQAAQRNRSRPPGRPSGRNAKWSSSQALVLPCFDPVKIRWEFRMRCQRHTILKHRQVMIFEMAIYNLSMYLSTYLHVYLYLLYFYLCLHILPYPILSYPILWYAVLCCAVLCCAVLCCAVLCCPVLCCAVLCCAVLCYAMLCYAMLCCPIYQRKFRNLTSDYTESCCWRSVNQEMWSRRCDTAEMWDMRIWRVGRVREMLCFP